MFCQFFASDLPSSTASSSWQEHKTQRQDPKGLHMKPKAKLNRRVQGYPGTKNLRYLWTASLSWQEHKTQRQDPKGLRMKPKAKLNRSVRKDIKL